MKAQIAIGLMALVATTASALSESVKLRAASVEIFTPDSTPNRGNLISG